MQPPKLLTMDENITDTPQLVWRIHNEDLLRAAEAPFEVRRNSNPHSIDTDSWVLLYADKVVGLFHSANRAMMVAANIHDIFRGRDSETSWTHPLTPAATAMLEPPELPTESIEAIDAPRDGWVRADDGSYFHGAYIVLQSGDLGCVIYKKDFLDNAAHPVYSTMDLDAALMWAESDEAADVVAAHARDDADDDEEQGEHVVYRAPVADVERFDGDADDTTPGGQDAKS